MSKLRYGNRVRERREELGLTRERLAVAADVSTSTVARLELDDKLPSVSKLASIALVLGMTIDELVAA